MMGANRNLWSKIVEIFRFLNVNWLLAYFFILNRSLRDDFYNQNHKFCTTSMPNRYSLTCAPFNRPKPNPAEKQSWDISAYYRIPYLFEWNIWMNVCFWMVMKLFKIRIPELRKKMKIELEMEIRNLIKNFATKRKKIRRIEEKWLNSDKFIIFSHENWSRSRTCRNVFRRRRIGSNGAYVGVFRNFIERKSKHRRGLL